jgi:hypothetical protein
LATVLKWLRFFRSLAVCFIFRKSVTTFSTKLLVKARNSQGVHMSVRVSTLVSSDEHPILVLQHEFVIADLCGSKSINDLNQLIKKLKRKPNRSNSCADNKTQKRPYFRREKQRPTNENNTELPGHHIQSACEEVSESVSMRPE